MICLPFKFLREIDILYHILEYLLKNSNVLPSDWMFGGFQKHPKIVRIVYSATRTLSIRCSVFHSWFTDNELKVSFLNELQMPNTYYQLKQITNKTEQMYTRAQSTSFSISESVKHCQLWLVHTTELLNSVNSRQ